MFKKASYWAEVRKKRDSGEFYYPKYRKWERYWYRYLSLKSEGFSDRVDSKASYMIGSIVRPERYCN